MPKLHRRQFVNFQGYRWTIIAHRTDGAVYLRRTDARWKYFIYQWL